jgi:hypothetical protein
MQVVGCETESKRVVRVWCGDEAVSMRHLFLRCSPRLSVSAKGSIVEVDVPEYVPETDKLTTQSHRSGMGRNKMRLRKRGAADGRVCTAAYGCDHWDSGAAYRDLLRLAPSVLPFLYNKFEILLRIGADVERTSRLVRATRSDVV